MHGGRRSCSVVKMGIVAKTVIKVYGSVDEVPVRGLRW